MASLYEEKSGRPVRNLPFFLCLGVWKVAIICEGLLALHLQGRAAHPRTGEMADAVLVFIERMHNIIASA